MTPPPRRCAIYTRKSSEEGLEQDFNSLHAQRESCEAYVLSQAGEGWAAIATAYDDGGISGGTMERPGLKRLLAEIAAGKIDVVVVYKVDRLTRSLTDFAKIVELFDRHEVSFVSVTQAFNTTSSMGRLTLNVLLSFAQFEREVTGERIRDKIAASKKKGLWMGGTVPLGYDPQGRTLVVNEAEAEQVRHIFRRYLQLKSVHRLKEELEVQGCRSKQRITREGKTLGGSVMVRGALFHLLSNRLYRGEIVHKGECYPGLHPAIVDEDTFAAAQALLHQNRRRRAAPSIPEAASPLSGRLFDEAGVPMSPTISYGRRGGRYRYYVSADLQRGGKRGSRSAIQRLPAIRLEAFVTECLARLTGASAEEALPHLLRLDVKCEGIIVTLEPLRQRGPGDDLTEVLARVNSRLADGERAWLTEAGAIAVSLPNRLSFRGGRRWLVGLSADRAHEKVRPDRALIKALRRAHAQLKTANLSPLQPTSSLVRAASIEDPYERRLVRLAFLAPDIQALILGGRQPAFLSVHWLLAQDLPTSWVKQRHMLAQYGSHLDESTATRGVAVPAPSTH